MTVQRPQHGRRVMTPDLRALVENIIARINTYSDSFGQVTSWSAFEKVGDKPADEQVAAYILEHLSDVDAAVADLVKLARKAVVCLIERGYGRTAADWRAILERHIRIARVDEGRNAILIVGSPKVVVDGIAVVGSMAADEQWLQVAANLQRTRLRIEPAPAHGRKAILACYGPSLAATLEPLRGLAAAGGDVVSVSGAHDYLIEHGIVPRYHVECDPRPHKAANVSQAHAATTYLLASCCHPDLFDKLAGADIRLWHIGMADHTTRLIDDMGEPRGTVIGGGSSVGLRAIPLLYELGYRDLAVFAMDCSFADTGEQWAGKHAGKVKDQVPVRCGNRVFLTAPVLLGYATQFFEVVQRVDGVEYELFGDGLLQEMAKHYANDALEAA